MHLIPAIDLRDGHCVRLLHGDFEAETRYPTDPETLLIKYRSLGADWLHIVDLDGARGGTPDNRAIILRLAGQKAVKLQVGGGLRNTTALAQVLDAGVARAVVGSAALSIERPSALLDGLCPGDYAYFVHSYALPTSDATIASTDYGDPFSACVQWRNFYGAQFHPERSAKVGAKLLRNFLGLSH